MSALLELARHPLTALARAAARRAARHSAASRDDVIAPDRYARERSQRMAQLEAAGKCLARPGKHANLRYWPADRGSRILLEHRRRQHQSRTAPQLA